MRLSRSRAPRYSALIPSDSPATFVVCTFSMLGKIAAADGRVSDKEIRRVKDYATRTLQLRGKLRDQALEMFLDAADSDLSLRDYVDRFQQTYPDGVQVATRLLEILLEVSAVDGVISPEEEKGIVSVALLLGFSESAYFRMKEKVAPMIH